MILHNVIIKALDSGNILLPDGKHQMEDGGPTDLDYWIFWLNCGIAYWNHDIHPEDLSEDVVTLTQLSVEIIDAKSEAFQQGKRLKLAKQTRKLAAHLSQMYHNNRESRSFSNPSSESNRDTDYSPHDPILRETQKSPATPHARAAPGKNIHAVA